MKSKDKLVFIILSILIVIFPLHRLVTYTINALGVTDSFLFDINKVYFLWFSLPFLAGIYIVRILKNEYKVTIFDYLSYILLILGLITSLFAVNKYVSIFGTKYRDEGLISIYTYIFIFLNAKNIKDKKVIKNLINIFLISTLIQSVYALLQVCTNLSFIRHYSIHYMASGLSGNPNFLGSSLVLAITISSIYFLSSRKYRYLLLSGMYMMGITFASSTGPFLTVIILYILLIYYLVIKKYNVTDYLIILLFLVLVFLASSKLIDVTHKTVNIEPNYNISEEIKAIASDNTATTSNYTFANDRVGLWKSALPLAKKYLIVGAGFDNFMYVYPYQSNLLTYDKAHNIYLETLICSGGLYLVVYLLLCALLVIKYFKIKNDLLIAVFLAFITYSIQGFANINVIDICFIFWMIMGFVNRLGESN